MRKSLVYALIIVVLGGGGFFVYKIYENQKIEKNSENIPPETIVPNNADDKPTNTNLKGGV